MSLVIDFKTRERKEVAAIHIAKSESTNKYAFFYSDGNMIIGPGLGSFKDRKSAEEMLYFEGLVCARHMADPISHFPMNERDVIQAYSLANGGEYFKKVVKKDNTLIRSCGSDFSSFTELPIDELKVFQDSLDRHLSEFLRYYEERRIQIF